jgi:hypothetical protein
MEKSRTEVNFFLDSSIFEDFQKMKLKMFEKLKNKGKKIMKKFINKLLDSIAKELAILF